MVFWEPMIKTKNYSRNTACRICGNKNLYEFLDLGLHPPANAFITENQIDDEKFFPLRVYFCPNCGLVQLLDIVSPELLFRDYAYFTEKSSETMKRHFRNLAKSLTKEYKLTKDDLVIDIGGNDGCLLKNFDCRTLNVEPARNVAKQARVSGIETVEKFFTAQTAWDILQEFGKAKVIVGTNVFAHVNNLYDFMAGVKCLLEKDGVFIFEVPYLQNLILKREWDTIYHEHLSYFSTLPLIKLVENFGYNLFKTDKISVHGGSIRCFVGKIYYHPFSTYSVASEEFFVTKIETYKNFGKLVIETKAKLMKILLKLKARGKRITGYGAAAKGNTLLNYCRIGPEILDYISDTTPYKQGKLTPGMHIPVVSPDIFHENPPDYALMLPWNYEREILEKEKVYIAEGGKFIIPIPEPRIVP